MINFADLSKTLFSSPWFLSIVLLWTLFWKGFALWRSANKRQLTWFIILLMVNTLGMLEMLYVLYLNQWGLGSEKLLEFVKAKLPLGKAKLSWGKLRSPRKKG